MSLYREDRPARVYVGDHLATAVYLGTREIWRGEPLILSFDASAIVPVPSWAVYCDRLVLGAGGGGSGGNNFGSIGRGGAGGAGAVDTITVEALALAGGQLTVTIGTGGPGGAAEKAGTDGGPTTITGPGVATLTGAGGTRGQGTGGAGYGGAGATVEHPGGLLSLIHI